MKPLLSISSALIILIAATACHGSSGAPVLTPNGPSWAEMTLIASSQPPTGTHVVVPWEKTQTVTAALPATPTQLSVAEQKPTVTQAAQPQQPAIQPSPVSPTPTSIPTPCSQTWFTGKASEKSCPNEPAVQLEAAYQEFEHGALLWRRLRGFIILPFNPATGTQSGSVSYYPDEITAYRDTSADPQWQPPGGLQAPVSGFGLIWRGDASPEPATGLKPVLGWATAPETGYTVTEQVGMRQDIYNGGNATTILRYLTLPDGRILMLSRLANPNQITSLSFITP